MVNAVKGIAIDLYKLYYFTTVKYARHSTRHSKTAHTNSNHFILFYFTSFVTTLRKHYKL